MALIISDGYNGTPPAFHDCEDTKVQRIGTFYMRSHAIMKVAKSTNNAKVQLSI